MKPYELARADAIRSELLAALGSRCAICGSKRKPEFNHIYGCEWQHNKLNRYQRLLRYRKEAALGLLNILCRSHNAAYRPTSDNPF